MSSFLKGFLNIGRPHGDESAGPRYLNTTAVFFSEVWGFGVVLPTSNGLVHKHVFFLCQSNPVVETTETSKATGCAFDPITSMSTEFIIELGHFHLHEACNPKTDIKRSKDPDQP